MRKIAALAAASALAAGLAGCSTTEGNSAAAPTTRTVIFRVDGQWSNMQEICAHSTDPCDPDKQGATVSYQDTDGIHRGQDWWYPTERTVTMAKGDTASIRATSTFPMGWLTCTIIVDGQQVATQRDEGRNLHGPDLLTTCSAVV